MNKDYYQHFDDLISHINKTIPTLVKEYNLEVYHSGGGCFILQIDKEKIEIGITPIEKIIINEKEIKKYKITVKDIKLVAKEVLGVELTTENIKF